MVRSLNKIFETKFRHGVVVTAILAVFIAYLTAAWPHLLDNWDSSETDQRDFLELGLDIRSGVRLTDGNRSPLLPLMLSLFVSYEWSYFTTAKLLSLGFAFLSLAILMFLNIKLFRHLEIALLSVALTAFNVDFLGTAASRVISESLFILFFVLTICFWYKGLAQGQTKSFALAGITAGLAYLTKGTAQLVLISFAIWALISDCRQKWLAIGTFITAYLIVASPFLIYNLENWGNPFYNYNSSHAMWFDGWDDKYSLADPRTATMGTYLASHDLKDIIDRFVSGGRLIIQKRWDVVFPLYSLVIVLITIGLFGINLPKKMQYSQILTEESGGKTKLRAILIPAVVFSVWFIFFSWYAPVSNSPRHFVPILPLVNTVISVVFFHAIASVNSVWVRRYYPSTLLIIVIVFSLIRSLDSVMTLNESYETLNVYMSDIQNNADVDELLHGLESSKNRKVTVVNGPNQLIPSWRARKTTLTIKGIPSRVDSMEKLSAFVQDIDADYLIVDADVLRRRPFLQDYFHLEDKSDFEMTRKLPNMELMANYRLNRKRIMIFERVGF